MSLLLATVTMAFAAPAGWEKFDSQSGCDYYRSPKNESGYPTLRAECVWSDVSVATLDAVLKDLGGHDKVHSSIAEATVVSTDSTGSVVYQRHVASGISDREANLLYARAVSGETVTHSWSMTGAQPTAKDGNVVPAKDTGKWELSPEGTGTKVIYELHYEPSGSVPGFVVRAFQTSGFVLLTQELHKAGQG
jgi:hypothetical protein